MPGPVYHPVATGAARTTVENHSQKEELVFWAGWRSWIVLEEKEIPYTYRETNPYLKEPEFIAISPSGLIPAIQHRGKPLHDSIVVSEYLEEAFPLSNTNNDVLLPSSDPYLRGIARIWIDYINKKVVPSFFRLLQAQSTEGSERRIALTEFKSALKEISSHRKGPYFFGSDFSLVDAVIAPWAVRDFIIHEYRDFNREDVPDWKDWAEKLESRPSVDREKYVDFNGTFLRNEGHSVPGRAASRGQEIP
ncbi:hypothetical protein CC1G_06890 [Paecilomyces variotii No. 5]|uniref:Glutathione S-transferase n=1 Tax=Byssochlamys spectabilis (strain No. 5 / NBRC 109023) TaxID=1356009 RepID=V5G1H0_BYSSN|nr:hypothetical protein CC1G_06890 [Paecilomyces variotii No. 5]